MGGTQKRIEMRPISQYSGRPKKEEGALLRVNWRRKVAVSKEAVVRLVKRGKSGGSISWTSVPKGLVAERMEDLNNFRQDIASNSVHGFERVSNHEPECAEAD